MNARIKELVDKGVLHNVAQKQEAILRQYLGDDLNEKAVSLQSKRGTACGGNRLGNKILAGVIAVCLAYIAKFIPSFNSSALADELTQLPNASIEGLLKPGFNKKAELETLSDKYLENHAVQQDENSEIYKKLVIDGILDETMENGDAFYTCNYKDIEYWMYAPANATENLPLMLLLGGTGGGSNMKAVKTSGSSSPFDYLNRYSTNAIVISPVYVNTTPTHGPNYNDLLYSTAEIQELVEYVATTYNCDPEKISAAGMSRGGIVVILAMENPGYYYSVTSIAGRIQYDRDETKNGWYTNITMENPEEWTTKFRFIHGVNDDEVKISHALAAYNYLKSLGVPAELLEFKKVPGKHGILYHTMRDRKVFEDAGLSFVRRPIDK